MAFKIFDKRTGKEYNFGENGKTKFKSFKTYGEATNALKAEGVKTVYTEDDITYVDGVLIKPRYRATKEEALELRESMIKEVLKLLNLKHGMKFDIDCNDHWTGKRQWKGEVREYSAWEDQLKGDFKKISYWPQFRIRVDLFELFEIKEV